MLYPTKEEVEKANHLQICRWWRFLPSPGTRGIGQSNFEMILNHEIEIMNLIAAKLNKFGGFTPEISRELGWK